MSRRNDGAVVFVVESGAAEINQAHIRPLDSSVIPFLLDKKGNKTLSLQIESDGRTVLRARTFFGLYEMSKSESTNRMFSGLRSV